MSRERKEEEVEKEKKKKKTRHKRSPAKKDDKKKTMSSRSPPRARPLPLRDAAGRVVDSTRAAAALDNFGSESTKGGGGGGRRASSTTSVMASSVGGGGGISFDLRSSPSSSSPSSSSFSALSLLVRRLLSTPLAPCLAYGAISICITLFNKAVFSVYKFQFPAFVTALQVSEEEERGAFFQEAPTARNRGQPSLCRSEGEKASAARESLPKQRAQNLTL